MMEISKSFKKFPEKLLEAPEASKKVQKIFEKVFLSWELINL